MTTFQIMIGDCLDSLKKMSANSVDSIVTDPPYGLSFMGKKWDYDVPAVDVWVECLRVLKPGGHLLAFAGTRTQHRMAVRIEDAGFEIRDMIAWVYGSGFPKSRNIGNDVDGMDGWGTALKPSMEPITFARKPLGEKTIGNNVSVFGVGALNIDGCRIETTDDLNGGAYSDSGRKAASQSLRQGSGMNAVGATAGEYVQPSGRWPANLLHDGSDEVVSLFPAQAGAATPVRGSEPSAASTGNVTGKRNRVPGEFHDDTGSAARFFYCAKTSRKDRNEGLLNSDTPMVAKDATMRHCETAEWSTRNGNSHPTVKPTDLMAYLLRLVTPPGGVALDPFMGSGSTGKAAMREGFEFIGCEIDEQYAAIAQARIEHELVRLQEKNIETDQLDLFGTA